LESRIKKLEDENYKVSQQKFNSSDGEDEKEKVDMMLELYKEYASANGKLKIENESFIYNLKGLLKITPHLEYRFLCKDDDVVAHGDILKIILPDLIPDNDNSILAKEFTENQMKYFLLSLYRGTITEKDAKHYNLELYFNIILFASRLGLESNIIDRIIHLGIENIIKSLTIEECLSFYDEIQSKFEVYSKSQYVKLLSKNIKNYLKKKF